MKLIQKLNSKILFHDKKCWIFFLKNNNNERWNNLIYILTCTSIIISAFLIFCDKHIRLGILRKPLWYEQLPIILFVILIIDCVQSLFDNLNYFCIISHIWISPKKLLLRYLLTYFCVEKSWDDIDQYLNVAVFEIKYQQ